MKPLRRPPPPVTLDRLTNRALHYLERFSASEKGLREVLLRRARPAGRLHGQDDGEIRTLVDRVVARMREVGFLDDRRFAEGRATTLARAGRSGRRIRETLKSKGVDDDLIDAAMRSADREAGELARAHAFARRRRLGPYRQPPDPGRRARDLAAMARAGFGLGMARLVIDGDGDIDDPGSRRDPIPG